MVTEINTQRIAKEAIEYARITQQKHKRELVLKTWNKPELELHLLRIDDAGYFTLSGLKKTRKGAVINHILYYEFDGLLELVIQSLQNAGVDVSKLECIW